MIRNCSRRGICRTQPQQTRAGSSTRPPADELDQSLVGRPFHSSQFTIHNIQMTMNSHKTRQYTTQAANGARAESAFRQEGGSLELTASLSLSLSYCHLRRCQMDRGQSQAPTKISVGVVICYLCLHPSALRHSPSWFWAYTVARSKSSSRTLEPPRGVVHFQTSQFSHTRDIRLAIPPSGSAGGRKCDGLLSSGPGLAIPFPCRRTTTV